LSRVGLQVADMNRVLDDVVRELVGFTVNDAALMPPPASQRLKTAGMVVASVIGGK